jgi:hypothetical protein
LRPKNPPKRELQVGFGLVLSTASYGPMASFDSIASQYIRSLKLFLDDLNTLDPLRSEFPISLRHHGHPAVITVWNNRYWYSMKWIVAETFKFSLENPIQLDAGNFGSYHTCL